MIIAGIKTQYGPDSNIRCIYLESFTTEFTLSNKKYPYNATLKALFGVPLYRKNTRKFIATAINIKTISRDETVELKNKSVTKTDRKFEKQNCKELIRLFFIITSAP
jgi:hypothetical protein